jgi:hypothetical protein
MPPIIWVPGDGCVRWLTTDVPATRAGTPLGCARPGDGVDAPRDSAGERRRAPRALLPRSGRGASSAIRRAPCPCRAPRPRSGQGGRGDGQRPQPGLRQPRADHRGAARWSVLAPDAVGHAGRGHQRRQDGQHAGRWPRGRAREGAPLPRALLPDRHPLQWHPGATRLVEPRIGPDVARRHGLH